jgi:hypothetical protein
MTRSRQPSIRKCWPSRSGLIGVEFIRSGGRADWGEVKVTVEVAMDGPHPPTVFFGSVDSAGL